MFLLDCEDIYSIKLQVNSTTLIEEIDRTSGLDESDRNMLGSEHYWGRLDLSKQSSLKTCKQCLETSLEHMATKKVSFFLERRLLIFKNRVVILELLLAGKPGLQTAFDKLITLSTTEAQNLVSLQNLAIVAVLLGKVNEAMALMRRAQVSDESFARVSLALRPNDESFLDSLKDAFDDRYWFIVSKGIMSYKKGEYDRAYAYLMNSVKRLENIRRDAQGKDQKASSQEAILSLPLLKSKRYDSKAIFSGEFIETHCPLIFFEELPLQMMQELVIRIRFLMAICNKFLRKPASSLSVHLDLLAQCEEDESRPKLTTPEPKPEILQIVESIGRNYLDESYIARFETQKASLVDYPLAKIGYGEVATLHLYSENVPEALLHALLYVQYTDPSFNILLEIVLKTFDCATAATKKVLEPSTQDLIDEAYKWLKEEFERSKSNPNPRRLERCQQTAFLGSFLEYKIKRDEASCKFLGKLQEFEDLLKRSSHNANSVLSYNLGIFAENPEEPLCASFSLNYSSWLHLYLKEKQDINPAEKIAALLISLNLNFDNQLCWNLLARFMMSQGYIKFSLQAYD